MTDWRKLLTDEHLWDYRCKAVPVPLVREIVEEVETLRQDLAAARATIDTMQGGYDRAAAMIIDLRAQLAAARALQTTMKDGYRAGSLTSINILHDVHLHYVSRAQAEAAFDAITDAIDAAIAGEGK